MGASRSSMCVAGSGGFVKREVVIAVLCTSTGLLAGYALARSPAPPSVVDAPSASGPTLARYAGRKLALGEAQAQLALPNAPSASLLSTPEGRKSYVEGIVRLDLLARLAHEKGYGRDPAFLTRARQELAAMYLEKEFEEPARKRAPTDDEVAKYFEESKGRLQRPEKLRLAVVAFRAEDDATRRTKRPVAQQVLAEIRRRSSRRMRARRRCGRATRCRMG